MYSHSRSITFDKRVIKYHMMLKYSMLIYQNIKYDMI